MIIRIYEVEGYTPSTCIGVLDDYTSFNFTKSFKKTGGWSIKGFLNENSRKLLVPGNLIYINDRISGIIEGVQFYTDEQGITTYEAVGCELKDILSYRILWQTYLTTPGQEPPVESWMRFLVWGSCIPDTKNQGFDKSRSLIHKLDVPTYTQNTIGTPNMTNFFTQAGENLSEVLTTLCQKFRTNKNLQLGFDVVCKDAKEFIFTVYEGEDRTYKSKKPIVFSREYDNVGNLYYTRSNANSVNVVRVVGDKLTEVVGTTKTPASGIKRKEHHLDIASEGRVIHEPHGDRTLTDEQYKSKLQKEGYQCLVSDLNNLEATIITKGTTLPDYSLLGAKVSLVDKEYNLKVDDWISEINFIDEAGEIEINYTIGEDLQAKVLTEVR